MESPVSESTKGPAVGGRDDARRGSSVRPRRPWRWLFFVLGVLAIVLAFAPELVERTWLRDEVLRRILGGPNLVVATSDASLGWLSPVEFKGLRLSAIDRPSSVDVTKLRTERPLWKIVFLPGDLGLVEIVAPQVTLAKERDDEPLGKSAADLAEAFRKPGARDPSNIPTLQFHVAGAGLLIDAPEGQRDWQLKPIEVAGGIQRPAEQPDGRVLVLEPSRLVNRAMLDPALCNDLLKFVAPILARAAWVQGSFSLEIDQARLPLGDPRNGTLAGRFRVHSVEAGPGPLFDVISGLLALPESIELANDSTVKFELREGRVYHEGLEFGPPALRSRSSGSVGLDETLDLHIRMPIPSRLLAEGEVRRSLAGREMPIHVVGTLRKPELDRASLIRDGLDTLFDVLSGARRDGTPLTLETLEQRLSEAAPPERDAEALPTPKQPGAEVAELIQEAAPLVQDLLKRRRENRAAAPPGSSGRPLRRLLDRLAPPRENAPSNPPASPRDGAI